ncbi:MAG TPA: DUF4383 domain-containing protein [Candidatus Dormibacteraeota bacterium]
MSLTKTTAGLFGAVYLLVGIVGFLPVVGGSDSQSVHNLLGLFPVNALHNVVHMAVGVLGLVAFAGGAGSSRLFARGIGVVYALLAVLGIFVSTGLFLGIVPIGGLDIALHAASAVVLLLVGFAPEARAPRLAGTA